MQDIETVSESFIAFLENEGIGTFNTNLFLNQVPDDAPDNCWYIITAGGSPIQKLATGEKVKQYVISVYCRSTTGINVERDLFDLEETLNCANCIILEGFEIIEIEATQFPSDEDLDNEERRIGFLQVNVRLYKTC